MIALLASPWGFYCSACPGVPVSDSAASVRRHFNERHPGIVNWQEQQRMREHAKRLHSHLASNVDAISHKFMVPGSTFGFICTCGTIFRQKFSAERHATKKENCKIRPTKLGTSICGRLFGLPTPIPEYIGSPSITLKSVETELLRTCSLYDHEEAFTYAKMMLNISAGAGLEMNIRNAIQRINSVPSETVFEIIQIASDWYSNYAASHVEKLPGNFRSSVITFEQGNIQGKLIGGTFNPRLDNTSSLRELQCLLKFALCNTESFHDFIREFNTLKQQSTDQNVMDSILKTGFIPQLIISIFLTDPGFDFDKDPLVVHFALVRFFKNLRHPEEKLRMNTCNVNSGRCASLVYIYRLAALAAGYLNGKLLQYYITQLQQSRVINQLCPIIKKLRLMDQKKPKANIARDIDGDIVIAGHCFKKDAWSTLIPRIRNLYEAIIDKCFTIKMPSYNMISRVSRNSGSFEFSFTWEDSSSKQYSSEDLFLANTFCDRYLQEIIGLLQLAFHGCGLGSLRKQETERFFPGDIWFENLRLYYQSQTVKAMSVESSSRRDERSMEEHRFPDELVPLFLAYCHVSFLKSNSLKKLIPSEPPYSMNDAAREIFQLVSRPNALSIRKAWGAIHNRVFPQNVDSTKMICNDDVATSFGHSASTHEEFYFSNTTKEERYLLIHKFLGGHTRLKDSGLSTGLTPSEIQMGLEILYGKSAAFLSLEQKKMVELILSNEKKNLHIGLHVGAGKSIAFLLPTVLRSIHCLQRGCSIVVSPYKFLCKSQFQSSLKLLLTANSHQRIECVSCDTCDMKGDQFPISLLQKQKLPDLLFMTVDCFFEMVKNFFDFLKDASTEGSLLNIIFDEVDAAYYETTYRHAYDAFPKACAVGCQVICLSATLPKSLQPAFAHWMRFANSVKAISTDICIGHKLKIDVVMTTVPYVMARSACIRHLQEFPQTSVHIICGTRTDASKVDEQLRKYKIDCRLVTSQTEQYDILKISRDWSDGKFDVLVGTTITLLGTDNARTQLVIICGTLYNLVQYIQSAGRIRMHRRTNKSRMICFPSTLEIQFQKDRTDENSQQFKFVLEKRMISNNENDKISFMEAFGSQKVRQAMDSGLCMKILLSNAINLDEEACRQCSRCVADAKKNAIAAQIKISTEEKEKQNTNRLLSILELKCHICNTGCDGSNCTKNALPNSKGRCCFLCGGYHSRKDCRENEWKYALEGRACYFCFSHIAVSDVHAIRQCRIKERLRAILIRDHIKSKSVRLVKQMSEREYAISFRDYLFSVYASKESFNSIISKISIKCNI